jgi:hypothetical protein
MKLKPSLTQKRIGEIEQLQEGIRQLGEQFKKDFKEPPDLASVIERDLKTAADSLDLLKGFYKTSTEKG